MKTLLSWIGVVAAVAIAMIADSTDAFAERRVALVVGNAGYNAAGMSLPNPRNDAKDMSDSLKGLGFEVVTATDANKRDMDLALQRFARLATSADAALFFYAGHAMQFQGRNFLVPIDAELEDEYSVRWQTVSLDDVRAALDRTGGVRIMVLDACRNNPLADRLRIAMEGASRAAAAATRGLAPMGKIQGSVVAYATAADEVAQDGTGRNSPYTAALLKRLQEPGQEISAMFRRVAADVNAQTGGRQNPETSSSLSTDYFLNQNDRIAWDRIKDQDDVAALRDFVTKYPVSPLSITARNRLDQLERQDAQRKQQEAQRKQQEDDARRVREEEELKLAEAEARVKVLREQQEERRRREAQQKPEEEQKILEAQRKREDEQKRLDALRRQQEEQRRQEALRQQQEEQKRQEALRKQQEEQKRQEALRKQQEEQKSQGDGDLIAALPPKREEPPSNVRPPAVQPANLPEQIRQAQTELRRLGCFSDAPDSLLNDATRNAVKALWQRTGRPAVEIKITDEFISELRRLPSDLCPPKPPVVAPHATPHRDVDKGRPHKDAQQGPSLPAVPPPEHSSPSAKQATSSSHDPGDRITCNRFGCQTVPKGCSARIRRGDGGRGGEGRVVICP